jgi:uncharacterized protein
MTRAAALLALTLVAPAAAAPELAPLPPLSGPVVDRAGLLSPEQTAWLEGLARELEDKTGAQTAVLTVESSAPEDLFDYGMRVAEAWQLGRRGKDDGLLLVVASRDRKARFFTGYGLEGVLPDGKLGRILDTHAIPRFRAGELGAGIAAAMQAASREIAAAAGVELVGARREPRAPRIDPRWLFLVAIVILLCLGGFGGGFRGGGGFGGGGGGFGGGGAGRGW